MLVAGLAAPIAVAVAVPLYSNAASARLFDEQVATTDDADAVLEPRDLAFLFSFNRLSGGSRDWTEVEPLDRVFLGDTAPERLPIERIDRLIETEPFSLLTGSDPENADSLGSVTLVSVTNFDDVARYVEGRAPDPATAAAGSATDPVEVAVGSVYAEQESLTLDQELILFDRSAALESPTRLLTIRIVGIWTDVGEPDDLVGSDTFRRRLIVPDTTITDSLSPRRPELIQNLRWRLVLDRSGIRIDNVASIIGASDRLTATAESLLAGTRQLTNPVGELRAFTTQERALRDGLRSFSLPLLALSGAVAVLIVNVALRGRSNEFVMLRRRGASRASLLVTAAAEATFVTLVAIVPGLVGAFLIAHTIGRTRTFFRFDRTEGRSDFIVAMNGEAWRSLIVVALAVLVVQFAAAMVATRRSIFEASASVPGGRERPWWQRSYVDVFAIVLIAVVTVRGVRDDRGRAALLDDPAVILLPAATALAAGLVLLRLAPLLMGGLAALLQRTDSSAALLAARRAARTPGEIVAPLLLLVITASLATFTASLAVTLDLQLLDTEHHAVGGEIQMIDEGISAPVVDRGRASGRPDSAVPPLATATTRHADFDDYARVWGVSNATPMIELNGSATHERGEISSLRFVGVDPRSFADLAFWRSDYGAAPLATLMAALDATPNGVLLANGASSRLDIGDELFLSVRDEAGLAEFTGVVVGRFDQFPRWFPDRQSPLVVGRAQLVEDIAGVTFDRRVLLSTTQQYADGARVEADYGAIGVDPRRSQISVASAVNRAQTAPGRQGVLGMLTVGVGLATLLTLAGFVITTVLAFGRRITEIGVLRAMGMTRREVAVMALFDLGTVMIFGLAAAIALGLAMSRWFIPVLVDTPPGSAPELLSTVAWGAAFTIGALLCVLLAASALVVAAALRRVRVFEAIRLGEE